MGQAYFMFGQHETKASFDYFFRKVPFEGGYVLFAGLEDLLNALEGLTFKAEDIDFLASQGLNADYIRYLENFRFQGSIFSVPEGEVIFPTEPIIRMEGTLFESQIAESMLLNILNYQSLVATKASRMRQAAGPRILSDFGLRRAPGLGAIYASRAAFIGGVDSTSHVYAGLLYDGLVAGTMAHSYIQSHEDELTAFRRFAEARPEDCTLLVDTYDTLRMGMPNAIMVAKEMQTRGHKLSGIRLDSGDLAYLSKKARGMLDDAGLSEVKIVVSNQLDEYVIRSLIDQGAPIDVFGIGTKLVTGSPDGALDGVFKLSMVDDRPTLKLSENLQKVTLPGRKQLLRLFRNDGSYYGADAIIIEGEGRPDTIVHPFEPEKSMSITGLTSKPMLQKVMNNGQRVNAENSVKQISQFARERMALLPDEYKRFYYPHIYKVGISLGLQKLRNELRTRLDRQKVEA